MQKKTEIPKNLSDSEIISIYNERNYQLPTEDKIHAAEAYFRQGDYVNSKNILEEIYTVYSSNKDFLNLYAVCLRRSGFLKEAKEMFEEAIAQDNNDNAIKNNYSNLLVDLGKYSEAKALLEEICRNDSNYKDARENLKRVEGILIEEGEKEDEEKQEGDENKENIGESEYLPFEPVMKAFEKIESKRYHLNNSINSKKNKSIPLPEEDAVEEESLRLARQLAFSSPERALELLIPLRKKMSVNPLYNEVIAEAYIGKGDKENALVHFLMAMCFGSREMSVLYNLATLYLMHDDKNAAYHFAKLANRLKPEDKRASKLLEEIKEMKTR